MTVQNRLVLFTEIFPYKGGETFLETEIQYLARGFSEVILVPELKGDTYYGELPGNVQVLNISFAGPTEFRKLWGKYFLRIAKYFLGEIIRSEHRSQYIRNAKTHLFILVGRLREADILKQALKDYPENENRYYTYWFAEWCNRLMVSGHKHVVSRVHLFDFEEEFQHDKFLPFRYTEMGRIEKIYPISDYARRYLEKRYGSNRLGPVQRLGVQENTLNAGGSGEEYQIVSNSTLSWYKRPLLLMEVLKLCKKKIRWVHFGDGAMEKEFLLKVKELPEHIQFEYKGRVDNKSIFQYYGMQPVDLILNLSVFEGIPVSMMEAIAAGIPLVGCNVCGVPEIVTEKTGMLLEKDPDVALAAQKIDGFLERCRDRYFRIGVQEFWRENYNAEKNYGEFVERIKRS